MVLWEVAPYGCLVCAPQNASARNPAVDPACNIEQDRDIFLEREGRGEGGAVDKNAAFGRGNGYLVYFLRFDAGFVETGTDRFSGDAFPIGEPQVFLQIRRRFFTP